MPTFDKIYLMFFCLICSDTWIIVNILGHIITILQVYFHHSDTLSSSAYLLCMLAKYVCIHLQFSLRLNTAFFTTFLASPHAQHTWSRAKLTEKCRWRRVTFCTYLHPGPTTPYPTQAYSALHIVPAQTHLSALQSY